VYVPGSGFQATQGSTNTNTDGQGNTSTPVALDINQIGDLPVAMAGNDGVTANTVLQIMSGFFNGTTLDQSRGNMDGITLINASNVTTDQGSTLQTNYNGRGVIVVFDMIDASASPSVTLQIIGDEPVTGTDWLILAGTAITANGVHVYRVYPGLTASANATANDIIPRTWGVATVANNANQATYKVCAIVMN
jgi:hypothetical protein